MSNGPGRRPQRDHAHVGRISTATIIFVLVVIAIVLHAIRWILLPFVLAGLLAYMLTPAVEWLAVKTGLPRSAMAGAVLAVVLLAGAMVGWLTVAALVPEVTDVLAHFQPTVEGLFRGLLGQEKLELVGQSVGAKELAAETAGALVGWLKQFVGIAILGGVAFTAVFGLFLSVVLLSYFLFGGPKIMHGLLRLVPPGQRPLIVHIWSRLDPVLKRYLVGIIAIVAYAVAAAYVGLSVLGIPHALFLALLTGVLELIPMIGPAASAVIAGLIAVRHATAIGAIVGYAVYATALRLSIDQFVGPVALGTAARLHPSLIIFCFLSGGILFGISGVILAVPVALLTKTTLAILYDEEGAAKRDR